MKEAKAYFKEGERLQELESFQILDTQEEIDFDDLTSIAAEICSTPISLVSFVDDKRQWFKSRHGIEVSETPKELSFCSHALHTPDEIFIVTDARKDQRFHDNPLVANDPHVIFYAGVPLVSEGLPLGTLCVVDHKPRTLTGYQLKALRVLSKQVTNLLKLKRHRALLSESHKKIQLKNELLLKQKKEIRKQRDLLFVQNLELADSRQIVEDHNRVLKSEVLSRTKELRESNKILKRQYHRFEQFSFIAAHNLRAPVARILGLASLFNKSDVDDENNCKIIDDIINASRDLDEVIHDLMLAINAQNSHEEKFQNIDLKSLINKILSRFKDPSDPNNDIKWETHIDLSEIKSISSYVDSILTNIISNSVKYRADNKQPVIRVRTTKMMDKCQLEVSDNGRGFDFLRFKNKVFEPFQRFTNKAEGKGLGMYLVKSHVDALGGDISVESKINEGTTIKVTLPLN